MRPHEVPRANAFSVALQTHAANVRQLPGLATIQELNCLSWQLVDSVRRIEYVQYIGNANLSPLRTDPTSDLFDPLRAAAIYSRRGNTDEAIWLTFLATHFGKHREDKWGLVRAVYGMLGTQGRWDWQNISTNLNGFRPWLAANQGRLSAWRFSNHRKYESLSATSQNGTAAVIESYVSWVLAHNSHIGLIQAAQSAVGQQPTFVFDHLYKSMSRVRRFGRLGKFDFLTMLDKLGLAPIQAGSAYLADNATGPKIGAHLLFCGVTSGVHSASELDTFLNELSYSLNVGPQVLEDALCNWQKSPQIFISFRG